MKILHIEDYDKEKGRNYAVALQETMIGHTLKNIEFLDELFKEKLDDYDFFLLDGQFPVKEKEEPDVKSFSSAINYLLKKGISKNKIIVWSNSTRVHKIASEMGLAYFSKKELSDGHYNKKGINAKYKAMKADEQLISGLIISSITKTRPNLKQ